MPKLTIWTNTHFPDATQQRFERAVADHQLLFAANRSLSVLASGAADPQLAEAEVAFGQPPTDGVIAAPKLKWVHLTSAGYTKFDVPDVRKALADRGGQLTNSSSVYAEPCAARIGDDPLGQPAIALVRDRAADGRGWPQMEVRDASFLLREQTIMIYGYGAIGARLAEMLRPFNVKLIGVRRSPKSADAIKTITFDEADRRLGEADHVVNILPGAPFTDRYFSADRLAKLKPTAWIFNIGRGTTIDQEAMTQRLNAGQLAGAYLDVTDPEPLPASSPLWQAKHCHITPHTAGGHIGEFDRLVDHFLANLKRYAAGEQLTDRVF